MGKNSLILESLKEYEDPYSGGFGKKKYNAFYKTISSYLQSNVEDIKGLPFDISPEDYERNKLGGKK